jgi:PAS domain S-box-containing protein
MARADSKTSSALDAVLDAVPQPAYALGPDGRIQAWNAAAELALGFERSGALGRALPTAPTGGDPAFAAALARAWEGGLARCVQQHQLPDGTRLSLEVALAPVRDGAAIAAVAVVAQATPGPAADAAPPLTALLDAIPVPIFYKDAAGVYLGCNAAFEDYLGRPRDEIAGRKVEDVAPPDLAAVYRAADEALMFSGGVQVYDAAVQGQDGCRREVRFHKAVFPGDGDARGGLVGTILDVTEQKRAERALRDSETKFRAAFHSAGLGILLVAADGAILEHNRAVREMLGFSEEELQRLDAKALLHPEDVEDTRARFEELVAGRLDLVGGERRYRRRDGGYVQVFLRGSAVRDARGEFLYAVAILEDATQAKAMEAKLAFADRMASMGTLAAGVAHEINNPLAFIVANVAYLLEELSRFEPRPTALLTALEETREGAARVREIVRDLMTFSRPHDRPDDTVDIRHVVRSSMMIAHNEIRHRARLVVELSEVPPVVGNAHRLGQVFLNILINAAHSIVEGRADQNRIRVACTSSEDGRVVVEIQDTGRGIPEELLPRIFEPFFTTKPVGEGTGLGLSICHGIVTGLGGEIRVESRVGQGTTFRIFLQRASG